MNGLYVNIKVDREERPDIDAIYMSALHRLGEQGGWPLTMFLDSDAKPFFGGTYFPKQSQYGRPAFVSVLLQIAQIYQEEPERIQGNVDGLMAALQERAPNRAGFTATEAMVQDLVTRITNAMDKEHGGLRGAPKFPQWNVLWLLWRGAMRFNDDAAKQAVVTTLTHICQGGIYDHISGGFARYSVDEFWLVPHFEKMLYDNALLLDLLTEVWRETQEPLFARRISESINWLKREMIADGGGFAASLDADSEGEEGKFYVWTAQEIAEVLGAADAAFFGSVYGVTPHGNFEGHTILNRLDSLALLSDEDEKRLGEMRCKLFARRAPRVRPGWDDKVLADWNGLMIGALARAGVVFNKLEWIALADTAFAFVSQQMTRGTERLWHSARAGRCTAPATASDYANMIFAALRLLQARGDARYLDIAISWAQTLDTHHRDGNGGGYFTAADDTDDVIVRLKSASDDAVPSANTIHLSNLIALACLTGDAGFDARASELYGAFQGDIAKGPVGHCGLLAASLDLEALTQIVVVSGEQGQNAALQQSLICTSNPGALEFLVKADSKELPLSALKGKVENSSIPTAYVCSGPVCSLPVIEPKALKERLTAVRRHGTQLGAA
jgi:uncharacterized protein